ncbi:MAG: hypothetical protein ACR2F2_09375 [Pyrinomonadaceae bacterium]
MKKLTIFLLLIVCVTLTAQKSFAQETEKEKFIRAAKFLEENPLDKNAKDVRTWAFVWAADTKDVTVIICGGTASPFLDKKLKFGSEMLHQYTIAMTAYKLQNPNGTDENAAQLAGVESALRVYEKLVADKPKGKAKTIDDLIAKRNNGELAKFVADADCGKK